MCLVRTWRDRPPAFPKFVQAGVGLLVLWVAGLPSALAADEPGLAPFKGIAALWNSYHAGKYDAAARASELAQREAYPPWAQQEAAHIQARCLWAEGTPQSRAAARKIWTALEKLQSLPETAIRLKIAKVLQTTDVAVAHAPAGTAPVAALPAPPAAIAAGIALLDGVVKVQSPHPGAVTAEAAMELAKLHGKAKQWDDAFKALDFAEKHLKFQITRELPAVAAEPFLKAIGPLRKRLQLDRDEGRAQFDRAEALRKAEKWPDAIAAYRDLLKALPACKYAPRADLHVGDCLLGEKKPAAAAEHWKKFVSVLPAGPWRAQAYIAMIDVYLEEVLDLAEAGKYAALAAGALPLATADENAAESWKLAAFELYVRIGLVNFCRNNCPAAAEAFEQAAKLALGKTAAENLATLIAAAKAGKGVIPRDCMGAGAGEATAAAPGSPADKVALALSMGVIYNLCGRHEKADDFFDRVRGVPALPAGAGVPPKPGHLGMPAVPAVPARPAMSGATPAQLAFATFGKGMVLQARGKTEEAKDYFIASIKTFRDGTWHDETLTRVAMIIQGKAAAEFAPPKPAAGADDKPQTPAQREAATKAEKERLAALLKAQGEALPYWQELLKRYSTTDATTGKVTPRSPRCEQALYYTGVLQYEMAEAVGAMTAEKAESVWKQVLASLARFTDAYPKSVYAGDTYVKHIDVALERMFDITTADETADKSANWVSDHAARSKSAESTMAWAPWQVPASSSNVEAVEAVIYDLRLRGVFAAYLREKYDKAKLLLAAMGPMEPKDGRATAETLQRAGLYFLQKAIAAGQPVWNVEVVARAKTNPQRTAIKLADLYLRVAQPEKSAAIYERILAKDPVFVPALPALEVHACIQIARSYSYNRENHERAIETLGRLYRADLAKEPQVAEGLVWLGTLTQNFIRDPKKAMPHLEYVVKHFPDSPAAERALYFYAIIAVAAKDRGAAEGACNEFLSRYPQRSWRMHVASMLKDEIVKLPLNERSRR
jgi:tetratricopeptide (TPR) repeat protein